MSESQQMSMQLRHSAETRRPQEIRTDDKKSKQIMINEHVIKYIQQKQEDPWKWARELRRPKQIMRNEHDI